MVELKSGETYNGHLVACDDWMNIHLKEVICTSRDGDRFWKMSECFIRGSIIKYLRIPEDVIDKVKEDMQASRVRNRDPSGRGSGGANRNKFRGALRSWGMMLAIAKQCDGGEKPANETENVVSAKRPGTGREGKRRVEEKCYPMAWGPADWWIFE
ncbi:putative U6 snRNA-associated Sm-like protein LSm4 [Taenia solium]